MSDARIATREDVKDVYAEGLTVGMDLERQRRAALVAGLDRLLDEWRRKAKEWVFINLDSAVEQLEAEVAKHRGPR